MNIAPEDTYTSPSFNSYSSDRLAETAGKVAEENGGADDDEFEFALVREDNEFLYEQIGPVFPVFCRDLLLSSRNGRFDSSLEAVSRVEVPLSQLLMEDRSDEIERDPTSCSSSDADELDRVPPGTYCLWRPKVAEPPSPSRCKKSKSTGSASRRWKLPEFLRRSNSDGKDSLVFLAPKHRFDGKREEAETSTKSTEKVAGGGTAVQPSAHEALYVRNRAKKENDRKKSYLPYRADLVGFFASANGLGKSSPRF